MTEDELDAIRQRRAAIADSLWTAGTPQDAESFWGRYIEIGPLDSDHTQSIIVFQAPERQIVIQDPAHARFSRVSIIVFETPERPIEEQGIRNPEAEFITLAPTDIDCLIAEVERLRKLTQSAES